MPIYNRLVRRWRVEGINECREIGQRGRSYSQAGKTGQPTGSTAAGGAIGSAAGAVSGAVVGRGAMVGAARGEKGGFLRRLFRRSLPNNAYKQFVQRCLKEPVFDP